jgi:hypothetical protein
MQRSQWIALTPRRREKGRLPNKKKLRVRVGLQCKSNLKFRLDNVNEEYFYEQKKASRGTKTSKASRKDPRRCGMINNRKSKLAVFFSSRYDTIVYRLKKYYFKAKDSQWSEKNIFEKVLYILVEFPLTVLRDFTIPSCDLDKWNRSLFIIMPLTTLLSVAYVLDLFELLIFEHFYVGIILLVIAILISILFWRTSYRNRLPKYLTVTINITPGNLLLQLRYVNNLDILLS